MLSAALANGCARSQKVMLGGGFEKEIDRRERGEMEEIRIPISLHSDIVAARLQGRAVAEQAGFKGTDLTVVYTVISEMARTIAESATRGEITISTLQESGKIGVVIIARTFLAKKIRELFFAHHLSRHMDEFKVSYKSGETILIMKKWVDIWTEESA